MEQNIIIKIQVAEDNTSIRERYVRLLSSCEEFLVTGASSTMQETIDMAFNDHPDVILMDIEMDTKEAGLLASKAILSRFPDIRIIILTVYEEEQMIFTAFQLQVKDYLLKNSDFSAIRQAIWDAWNDRSPIHPEIAGKIRSEFKRIKDQENSLLYLLNIVSTLTPTELEILYLLTKGISRSDICKKKCVEPSTLKSHIHRILSKFGRRNVQNIISEIQEMNLLSLMEKFIPADD